MNSFFQHVEQAPPDPIFGLNQSFADDPRGEKVNLGAGVYKTAELKPFILTTVKKAEARILEKETDKDYLPIDGLPSFVQQTKTLVFGGENEKIYGAQTAGGTGALRIGGTFLKEMGLKTIYLSEPTWDNHQRVFKHAGLNILTYPYFNWKKRGFDCAAAIDALDRAEKKSAILWHACCHNPTGCDPTLKEWEALFEVARKKEIFPIFDFAYQGFGDGLPQDAQPLRRFVESGGECAVAVSCAKNFGLYAERCGALFMVGRKSSEIGRVGSQIKVIIRGLYSNPPCHGARIVAEILGDETLKGAWEKELEGMRLRIIRMRHVLAQGLKLDFLEKQKGMFSYTGLSEAQVERLSKEYGIYMPRDGRINVAGLNSDNLDYVICAVKATKNI